MKVAIHKFGMLQKQTTVIWETVNTKNVNSIGINEGGI